MKKVKNKQTRKHEHVKLPVQKHVEEQQYSEAEGLPPEEPLPDNPFAEEDYTDEIKKEEEEEFELYYT